MFSFAGEAGVAIAYHPSAIRSSYQIRKFATREKQLLRSQIKVF
ncbi:MAG: hypothetical protein WBB28_09180 [Crinalium sp.]